MNEKKSGTGNLTHCPYHPRVKLTHSDEEWVDGNIEEDVYCEECDRRFTITFKPEKWVEK